MKMQTPEEIKLSRGLPQHASFHGWLIHNPYEDDFLLSYKKKSDYVGKFWTGFPDKAMTFPRLTKAMNVLKSLELEDRAIVVAAFDLGKQIVVIVPEEYQELRSIPSTNPARTDVLKH